MEQGLGFRVPHFADPPSFVISCLLSPTVGIAVVTVPIGLTERLRLWSVNDSLKVAWVTGLERGYR